MLSGERPRQLLPNAMRPKEGRPLYCWSKQIQKEVKMPQRRKKAFVLLVEKNPERGQKVQKIKIKKAFIWRTKFVFTDSLYFISSQSISNYIAEFESH